MAAEETEIERIERELDILRARRALYAKWAPITTIFCVGAGLVTVLGIVAAVVFGFIKDPVFGIFIAGMIAAVAGLIWISSKTTLQLAPDFHPDPLRRVGIVRSQRRPAGLVPLYKRYAHPYSIRTELDEMIAWREQRLAELRGRQP